MKPTLVIMAAGMGSRYGGLKQVEPVGPAGEIVMDYSIFDALRAGFGKVVFVIRKDFADAFTASVAARWAARAAGWQCVFQQLADVPAGYAVPAERAKPWGTAHAVYAARTAVHEPFAVINADDFYGAESFRALAGHLAGLSATATDYCMVGFRIANTLSDNGQVSRGVCHMAADGSLDAIVERQQVEKSGGGARCVEEGRVLELPADTPVSMNCWGFTPTLFPVLEQEFKGFLAGSGNHLKAEFQLPSVVAAAIRCGAARVRVLATSAKWLGVTYPEDKAAVMAGIRDMVLDRQYPSPLW